MAQTFDSASQALAVAQEQSADVEAFLGLSELAKALARSGQSAAAIALAKRTRSAGGTGDVMRLIVIAQLDAGDELGALETARQIKPASHRGGALREVARRATRTEARVLRDAMPQENDAIVRTQVLLGLAEGLLGGPPATKPP